MINARNGYDRFKRVVEFILTKCKDLPLDMKDGNGFTAIKYCKTNKLYDHAHLINTL
jgi:hypothetical protein